MGKRITVKEFIMDLGNMSEEINKKTLKVWDRNTKNALSEAKKYAPQDTGELIRSGARIKAKVKSNGIGSSFIFAVPYAKKLNDNKEGFTIKRGVNPLAQDHYAEKGESLFAEEIIPDLKKLIGKVWTS